MNSDDLFLQEKWNPEQEEEIISDDEKVVLLDVIEKLENVSEALDNVATIFQKTREWGFSNYIDRTSYDVADIKVRLGSYI